ncbi:MAG: glycosyltransferase family 2 protein [SAR324 cluster bacterium]|nr:glycosyltransferase family 2 protein [SAR324 cluster bacterium]
MNVKLSVVILSFNEERDIERCLKSVVPVADEIVVVDSYSTDRTAEICQKYGVRFILHPFAGHIEQKNWANGQASHPYILSLDSDEALDETLRQAVLKAKENWQGDGYTMNRLTNYCGKWIRHCGWYPDQKLRLWESKKGKWTGINPHDRFELLTGSQTRHLQGNILHYSYYSISEHIQQTNFFTDLSAAAYLKKGKKGYLVKVIFNPLVSFIKTYFLKLGLLDGYYGFVISMLAGQSTFLKYAKLRQLQQSLPEQNGQD